MTVKYYTDEAGIKKIVLKDGKVSCSCCVTVCDGCGERDQVLYIESLYITGLMYDGPGLFDDVYMNYAGVYVGYPNSITNTAVDPNRSVFYSEDSACVLEYADFYDDDDTGAFVVMQPILQRGRKDGECGYYVGASFIYNTIQVSVEIEPGCFYVEVGPATAIGSIFIPDNQETSTVVGTHNFVMDGTIPVFTSDPGCEENVDYPFAEQLSGTITIGEI